MIMIHPLMQNMNDNPHLNHIYSHISTLFFVFASCVLLRTPDLNYIIKQHLPWIFKLASHSSFLSLLSPVAKMEIAKPNRVPSLSAWIQKIGLHTMHASQPSWRVLMTMTLSISALREQHHNLVGWDFLLLPN